MFHRKGIHAGIEDNYNYIETKLMVVELGILVNIYLCCFG